MVEGAFQPKPPFPFLPSSHSRAPICKSPPMPHNNSITVYDLALSTGATISPFVWATKYALKHKGFELDVVPGGFTGIPERTGGKTERLPAIVDDGHWVLDSWGIVEYLDEAYPDRPMVITHPSVAIVTRAREAWFVLVARGTEVRGKW